MSKDSVCNYYDDLIRYSGGGRFSEADELRERTAAGQLPPVEQRLPKDPLVIKTWGSEGRYGGTCRIYEIHPDFCHYLRHMNEAPLLEIGESGQYHHYSRIDGPVCPGVLSKWETSLDGKRHTLTIREGLRWSDGHLVTAEDARYTVCDVLMDRRIRPWLTNSKGSDIMMPEWEWLNWGGEAVSLEVLDDQTFVLVFERPYQNFIRHQVRSARWQMLLRPSHYLKQYHDHYADSGLLKRIMEDRGFIPEEWGSFYCQIDPPVREAGYFLPTRIPDIGRYPVLDPWIFEESREAGVFWLKRNPYYYVVDTEGRQLPYIDRIERRYVPAFEQLKQTLRNGAADISGCFLKISEEALYRNWAGEQDYDLFLLPPWQVQQAVWLINLCPQQEWLREITSDKRFRQALSLAIDRKAVCDQIYRGKGYAAQAAPARDKAYYRKQHELAFCSYDPESAGRLLDEMGLGLDPADGIRYTKNGRKLEMDCVYYPVTPMADEVVGFMEKTLQRMGIVMRVIRLEHGSLMGDYQKANSHIFTVWEMAGDDPLIPYQIGGLSDPVPLWWRWYETEGREGVEPNEAGKELYRLRDQLKNASGRERRICLAEEIYDLQAENLWILGFAADVPQPVMVKRRLKNVDEAVKKGYFLSTLLGAARQWWIDDEREKGKGGGEKQMRDRFANIAAGYRVKKERGLVRPEPEMLQGKVIRLTDQELEAFEPYQRMETKEELDVELDRLEAYYGAFMQNLSPDRPEYKTVFQLRTFQWRLCGSKAEPVSVTVPHYGGPTGLQEAVYETTFQLPENGMNWREKNQRVFICFKGVDYIAQVFVNGYFLGSHEGFFAPFEFDMSQYLEEGINQLKVIVKNDYIMMGNETNRGRITGDKIYAATGPGWDDPQEGWHHCPPGMGIYQDVTVEIRDEAFIGDLFVRQAEKGMEVWITCNAGEIRPRPVSFRLSLYGQNFSETIFEDVEMTPMTYIEAGLGDTLNETRLAAEGQLGKKQPLLLEKGCQRFILPFTIQQPKVWSPDEPWLYRLYAEMIVDGKCRSGKSVQFGIRTFYQDLEHKPRGRFYLNGEPVRLRGANTMGFEQQRVMKGETQALIRDLLMAKACHMNFLRLTQRPVQPEIYDLCDQLGLMIQTDLPLFGTIRIHQFCEVLRQTAEMEQLIRSHPCCILVSYINEPFPNANNMPHRMLTRPEMERFFSAADEVVRLHNPDRVIKHVDGDYDPPSRTMPDNHCYTMWYNGQGITMGQLHKGYWMDVKPGWYFGCGEFGAEGLDFKETMLKYYPKAWLAGPFHPNHIVRAQSGNFHYFFYETPETLEDWISESQRHQAFATRIMTKAMRRQKLMNTFAIHLFIDAFPAGWMKAVIDCERNPKPAYFEYRDCLSPLMADLRSDRLSFYSGETAKIESYICNDLDRVRDVEVRWWTALNGRKISGAVMCCDIEGDTASFIGYIEVAMPRVQERSEIEVYMTLSKAGKLIHGTKESFALFPTFPDKTDSVRKIADLPLNESMAALAPELRTISWHWYMNNQSQLEQDVYNGRTIIFEPLPVGVYHMFGRNIEVSACQISPVNCVSRNTGHELIAGFRANDFSYWYNEGTDCIDPILETTFSVDNDIDVRAVLTSARMDGQGNWKPALACAEWSYGRGKVIICQLLLAGREKNPAAAEFIRNLMEGDSEKTNNTTGNTGASVG